MPVQCHREVVSVNGALLGYLFFFEAVGVLYRAVLLFCCGAALIIRFYRVRECGWVVYAGLFCSAWSSADRGEVDGWIADPRLSERLGAVFMYSNRWSDDCAWNAVAKFNGSIVECEISFESCNGQL